MTQPTFIIDGYGFVFRAYHVQPPLSSPSGTPVGALYGFTSMLIKILGDFKPSSVAMVFDGSGKNFRHDLYPEYKSHRPPAPEDLKVQFPLMREAAKAFGFHIIEQKNVEADDVIASLVRKLAREGKKSVIVSCDKDLMQLIGDDISMYDPMKNKYIKEPEVFEKFGVAPSKVRDVLALMGDSSDNIPGVAGIGPKTAAELIERFGSLHGVLEGASEIRQEKRRQAIEGSRGDALLSWDLVGLKEDLDVDITKLLWERPDRATCVNFIAEYGFKSLIPRAEKLFGMDLDQMSLFPSGLTRGLEESYVTGDSRIKSESDALKELCSMVKSGDVVAIYLEHKRLRFATKTAATFLDNLTELPDELLKILVDPGVKKITVNLKRLLKYFASLALDARVSGILPNQTLRSSLSLVRGMQSFDDIALMHYASSAGNQQPPPEYFYRDIFDKYEELERELAQSPALKLYKDIDLLIAILLYKMEQTGILVDKAMLEAMSSDFAAEISQLEEKIYQLCGAEFNIGSPKQLGEVLFDKMKLPGAKISSKAKTYSTGAEILEHLSESGYEVADHLLRWRQISKLKNTYTDSLPKQIDTSTGRVHTTFIQNMTSTGRLSSTDPNLQNIPIRSADGSKIRKAFIAKPGYKLISADYSQIELRLLSHVAQIKTMQDAFRNGADIHAATASQIFKISQEEMTDEYRRRAKAINFGIIYGISSFGLAKQLGIDQKSAGEYIASYFQEYPGIEKYMQDTKEFAHKHGYVENIFSRRHHVPSINSPNHMMRNFAERAAINAPLQGSTADIAKMAMLAVDQAIIESRLDCQMLLQVHDELIFEVAEQDVKTAMPLIQSVMEQVVKLDVPLVVDINFGDNWGQIH
jgi:DNA polymerase-1